MENVLVIAPHLDDEIIGVGGTIIKHIKNGDKVYVCCVALGKEPVFKKTNIGIAEASAFHKHLGIIESFFLDFPAVMLEKVDRYIINNALMDVVTKVKPNTVYIPHCGDMQKDHQIVTEAAMVVMRPKYDFAPQKIYAYETLSETGWNVPNVQNEFIPNVFVNIESELQEKLNAMNFYKTELAEFPNARSLEAIEALAKYRGALMNMRAAEAFALVREQKY